MELTILDPVLNDMGPLTRRWILENVLHTEHPRTFDIMPTKSAIVALEKAGFGDINKNWLWVPVTSVGDEISTVTSEMGRWWYEELYAGGQKEERGKGKEVWERNGEDEEGVESPREHRTLGIWEEKEIMDECRERNSSFRWLKVWARKMEGVSGELPA